jgi:hypothetical protein
MLSHGADLDSLGTRMAGLLDCPEGIQGLEWKVRLLRSSGFSDWQIGNGADNLLHGACQHRHLDLVLFALEIANIDPNWSGGRDRTPISNAAARHWLEGVAVLLEAGARLNVGEQSWNGPPLVRSLEVIPGTNMSHYLLLHGPNPRLCDSYGGTAWRSSIENAINRPFWQYNSRNGFFFIHFESSVSHMLYHGADPFEAFATLKNDYPWPTCPPWFDDIGYVRASDIARFWSYGILEKESQQRGVSEEWERHLEEADRAKRFEWTFCWNNFGKITRIIRNSFQDEATTVHASLAADDDESQQRDIMRTGTNDNIYSSVFSTDGHWTCETTTNTFDWQNLSSGYYTNATRFYHHVSNEQGRRQLSRFPMVRALCDALIHSGYRAEMDDDGDMWYDCDDRDRYFDACEHHVESNSEIWFPDFCPICEDFDGYGLGHVWNALNGVKSSCTSIGSR